MSVNASTFSSSADLKNFHATVHSITIQSMDAFKLLTRSTKLKLSSANGNSAHHFPSEGPAEHSITISSVHDRYTDSLSNPSPAGKKRKRGSERLENGRDTASTPGSQPDDESDIQSGASHKISRPSPSRDKTGVINQESPVLDEDKCRIVLKSHKIKVVDLTALHDVSARDSKINAKSKSKKSNGNAALPEGSRKTQKEACRIFPQPLTSFKQLRTVYNVNQSLTNNVVDQGFTIPTEVQLASLPLLLGSKTATSHRKIEHEVPPNLLTVAATGSGKTLAFLIPLIDKLVHQHHETQDDNRHVSALILAPTKELVTQIVNEGRKLTQRTGVSITAMRKGMALSTKIDGARFEDDSSQENGMPQPLNDMHGQSIVKSDILVTTPLLLLNAVSNNHEPDSAPLSSIHSLILDEADVLLDPLFREQTLALWNACTNSALHVSFWSATIGSNIEELVMSVMKKRQSQHGLTASVPLLRCVVGLKDSALPTISHKLVYAATEPGKLLGLRQLLHPSPAVEGRRTSPPLRPPFLVFTQTIERAIALHSELLYDIPSEAGGSNRIAVLHSDLSDSKRSDVMARFRKGQIWVLITTDLLSRGIDFRGINGVVNYDIPTTSAAYVHRVGRTGRAGREGGAAVTYYTKDDIKYVKGIANVIAASQKGREKADDGSGIKPWLLNALPEVSKKDKQKLKTRGVEVRRSIKEDEDPKTLKAKRKARISTKSGYDRKLENNRKGAVRGSQSKQQDSDAEDNEEWGGIDH